jgi:hypothetical protein
LENEGKVRSECYRARQGSTWRHGPVGNWRASGCTNATGRDGRWPVVNRLPETVDEQPARPLHGARCESPRCESPRCRVAEGRRVSTGPMGSGARGLTTGMLCFGAWTLWIPACRLRWPAIRSYCRLSARWTVRSSVGRSSEHPSSGYAARARVCAGFEGSDVSHPKEADTAALIAALHRAGVQFIVVGGAGSGRRATS